MISIKVSILVFHNHICLPNCYFYYLQFISHFEKNDFVILFDDFYGGKIPLNIVKAYYL